MREPIESEYFNWLCAKVLSGTVNIYYDLMRILHQTEFRWVVPEDKNRADDGLELRTDFLRESDWGYEGDWGWLNEPCSVFELLIAFAKRANFQTDIPTRDWFWVFLRNLRIDEYRRVTPPDVPVIDDILRTFIERTYDENGYGGLFPLRWPKHDQTKVEIWYQFCEYVDEEGLI